MTLTELLAKATERPWSACGEGKCPCGQVWGKHHPVCEVTRGEWGDSFPDVRLRDDGGLGSVAEAYMQMLAYGSVDDVTAEANAALIVLAVNSHDALVAALGNLIWLADHAMRTANRYDITAGLAEAKAALAAAGEKP